MKILVEVSWGMGNMVQGTPLCSALRSIGHDVDLFIHNHKLAEKFAPLFRGWDVLGNVFTTGRAIEFDRYDLGVCCFGERRTAKRLPPGFCFEFGWHNQRRRNETELNLSAANRLGFRGLTPRSHVQCSSRDFGLKPGTVVVHAGCDPKSAAKRWGKWGELCIGLQERSTPVVIVGTDADRSADHWESRFNCHFNLPLDDLAALLDQATVYAGNDSGVGHIAAAVGLPGVILFGPSDPLKNAPNSRVLHQVVVEARPGETRRPTDANAVPIDRIEVDQVRREVETRLANPQRDPVRDVRASPVPPDPQEPPAWPSQAEIESVEDWLQQLCTWNAARMIAGEARPAVVSEGKRLARRAHLKLAELYTRQSGALAARQAKYHAQMAVRAGSVFRGTIAKIRARRGDG